ACPPLLANGSIDGRRFLALRWIPGIDAVSAAAELRQQGDRAGLLALLGRIALAYAELHRRGVLHGDIHPGNLLIGRDGAVSVVDLGLAQMIDAEPGPVMRGGVGFFMEPEYARATLAHRPPPPPTPA